MRQRIGQALLLIIVIALTTAGLAWNSARVAPLPDPGGDHLVLTRHASWADLYIPAGHDTLPALLFSPGFGAPIASYATFLTDVASHGYIVVAVPHPSIADPGSAQLADVAPEAARTLVAAMDLIAAARGDSILSRVDPGRVAVFGHSIGGNAAAEACFDPRFKAAIDIDGSLYGRVVHEGVACPFLLVEASLSRLDTADAPVFYEERSQGRLHEDSVIAHSKLVQWVTIDGLDHMSFTDPELTFRTKYWAEEMIGMRLNAGKAQRRTVQLIVDFLGERLGK